MSFNQKLKNICLEKNNRLCIGLDIDNEKLSNNSLDFMPQQATGDGWWEIGSEEIINIMLPETDYYPDENYLVRLYVQDVSGYYSNPDSMTIQVTTNIPVPAEVENLIPIEESLYYIHLGWDVSEYDPPHEQDSLVDRC